MTLPSLRRITGYARLYCGHALEFRMIYMPVPGDEVWCYRCHGYHAVHDTRKKLPATA